MNPFRIALVVGSATAFAWFLLLYPFACDLRGCHGLVAHDYSRDEMGGAFVQAGGFSLAIGAAVALIVWLLTARPTAPQALRLLLASTLAPLTFLIAISPGGAAAYAWPILIPVWWWMARHRSLLTRALAILMSQLLAFQALWILAYSLDGYVGFVLPLFGVLGVLILFLATTPDSRESPSR